MKIKKVELKNFKRFDNLTIDLGDSPKKIVGLVGPNGCGKSSVFDGFLYLQNTSEHIGQFGIKSLQFYWKKLDSGFNDDARDHVKITFDSGSFQETFLSKRTNGDQKTIFSFRSSHRYSSNLDVATLTTLPNIKQNDIGASHSVDLDDKITLNYQRLFVYLTNYRKEHDLTDKQAIEQVLGQLNSILSACLDIEIVDLGDIMDAKGRLFFKKPDASKFDYNLLSSGEKEVVDILLDIFLKKDSYKDTIYCIDEPELHLNTAIQRKLLLEIVKLIPDNCQLWIATHSIGFLRALQEELKNEAQILDFSESDYFSGDKIIKPIAQTRKNWQRIFSTALEDLTGLIAPKKIIYCEGRKEAGSANEEQGLDAQVYNQIFSEEFNDSLFVSSGGNTEPEENSAIALKVLSKAFMDVELFLLKDRDTKTNEERTSFLAESSKNRMLERIEIENYLFDSEVLKKYCTEKNITFDDEKYRQTVSDIKTQDLKLNQTLQSLQQLCNARGAIKNFKIELANYLTSDTDVYKELKQCVFN